MSRRFSNADLAAAIAAALGVIVTFLPWYSYAQGSAQVTVNGFRASVLGDAFFIDLLQHRISQRAAYAVVAGVAVASVVDQFLLAAGSKRSVGAGLILALLVAIGMVAAAWLRGLEPQASRTSAFG